MKKNVVKNGDTIASSKNGEYSHQTYDVQPVKPTGSNSINRSKYVLQDRIEIVVNDKSIGRSEIRLINALFRHKGGTVTY